MSIFILAEFSDTEAEVLQVLSLPVQVVEEEGELGGVTMKLLEPETTLTESPTRADTKTPPRWSK